MVNRTTRTALAIVLAAGVLTAVAHGQATTPPQSLVINEHLKKTWKDQGITPAKAASDNEFIRRVFIDLIGRIPTAEEVRDYERDRATNKRAKLVNRLLHAEAYRIKDASGRDVLDENKKPIVFEYAREHAEHWAGIWTVWLLTRGGIHEQYHSQMEFWLKRQFMKNIPYDELVKELLTASGDSNKNGAVIFVITHLGDKTPADQQVSVGPFDAVPITSRVTRLFLGVQTQCTQCHPHPFNTDWDQDNFWGTNAFFRTTFRKTSDGTDLPTPPTGMGKKNKNTDAVVVTLGDNPRLNSSTEIYYEKRTGVLAPIKPRFLPDLVDLDKDKSERPKKTFAANSTKSRREVLADYIVAHDNFGKAYVNRLWAHFFGRGLNEQPAADDFGPHNKVVHPELLESLGQEFKKYKYDTKALMEWICNSDAYNLSYVAPSKEMAKPDFDAYFGRMPLKAMSPEVLFESLTTATKVSDTVDKEAHKAERAAWMQKLVANFGDDEGNETTFNGTIVQALLMMNGRELNEEIRRSDGFVAKLLAKAQRLRLSDQAIIDEIFLTALARRPSTTTMVEIENIDPRTKRKTISRISEAAFVQRQLAEAKAKAITPKDPKGANAPAAFYEDLFWTLLNTNEFMLNH